MQLPMKEASEGEGGRNKRPIISLSVFFPFHEGQKPENQPATHSMSISLHGTRPERTERGAPTLHCHSMQRHIVGAKGTRKVEVGGGVSAAALFGKPKLRTDDRLDRSSDSFPFPAPFLPLRPFPFGALEPRVCLF